MMKQQPQRPGKSATARRARQHYHNIKSAAKPDQAESTKCTTEDSILTKPYEPYELDGNKSFGVKKSEMNTTTDGSNPTKEETLGQNQVADIVSDVLSDSMTWDSGSGQWFVREDVAKPFTECDAENAWRKISISISQIKPKYTSSFVNGVEKFVKAQLAVNAWDSTRNILPVSNGVLDLGTRELRDYRHEDRFNWQLPYPFDPSASCPLVNQMISRMVGGDTELIKFLDSWLLVALLGRSDVQAFLELVGDGGTGKSTFLRLLAFLVGEENVRSTDLHSLEQNQFETAALYGKRLTIITDSARYRGEVPVLKSITGGDPVRLERKHQQQRKPYVYEGLVAIAANQPLESSDYSSGLKRRRRSISINYKVSDEERLRYRDKDKYPKGFEGELQREMPGLLNRLLSLDINHAVNLIASPNAAMQRESLVIDLETNPLLAWADENLVRCESNETQIGDKNHGPDDGLYSNYCQFVESNGQRAVSLTRFSRALLDTLHVYGIETEKNRSKFTYLTGLRLRKPSDVGSRTLISDCGGTDVGLSCQKSASVEFVEFARPKHSQVFFQPASNANDTKAAYRAAKSGNRAPDGYL